MSEFISEFSFTLSSPIQVASNGSFTMAKELLLKAPSNKQRHESAKLKQGFFRALKSMADNESKDKDLDKKTSENKDTISGDEVMSIIMMSDVDLSDYQNNFRTLILNDACTIEGVKLTAPLFDLMSDSDTERLMGEYIANFLLASHLQKMMQK